MVSKILIKIYVFGKFILNIPFKALCLLVFGIVIWKDMKRFIHSKYSSFEEGINELKNPSKFFKEFDMENNQIINKYEEFCNNFATKIISLGFSLIVYWEIFN